jgi:hypothetical protein
MSENLSFTPPGIDFDPQLASDLSSGLVPIATDNGEAYPLAEPRRSPFHGYIRMLTPEGGILIFYRDQDRGMFLTILRGFTWTVATGLGGWLVFFVSSLNAIQCLLALIIVGIFNAFLVRRPIEVSHRVEIRPDAMIVDGKDVFYAEDIGENWPELQMKDEEPDRMVISGICGTRLIEYMTANRIDQNDRTPEILADDLQAAMEQLWDRREVSFPSVF